MFKTGDKVRVNAKLGKMRESKWIEGTILESDFEDDVLVETRFQKVWSSRKAVKIFKKLEYDSTNHVWPAVEKFKNKYWDDLKSCVSKALEEFFPNIKMVVDEEEKIINIDNYSIGSGIEERETLTSFIELPVWNVSVEAYYEGNIDEPPSSDLIDVGSSASSTGAARFLIESMMKDKIGSYFDNIVGFDSFYAEYVEMKSTHGDIVR
jgi:hypothetical protein